MRKEAITPEALMVEAMRHVGEAADHLRLPILIVGATARMLLLERLYGLEPGRRTLDVDYAVAVESWEDDRRLRALLVGTGVFEADLRRSQRLRFRGDVTVDIIPFGGVENERGEIEWPDDEGVMLSVLGLSDLLSSSISVEVDDKLRVPVISPEGLLVSKLIAWQARGKDSPGRDAADIGYVLRYAERIIGIDSLYEEHMDVLVASDYRMDLAAVRVLGSRLFMHLRPSVRERIQDLLMTQLNEDSELVRDAIRYGGFREASQVVALLDAFLRGLS